MHLKLFFFFNFGCSGSWCFVRAFSLVAVGVRGATLVAVRGLLAAGASSVAEHRLWGMGLSTCSSRAQ